MALLKSAFKFALVQLKVGKDKGINLTKAADKVAKAASEGARMVSLPEFFNAPCGHEYFREHKETVPHGWSCDALSEMAVKNNVYLIGGSIPEEDGSEIFNTCTVWSPSGEMLTKYRKIHLFDVNMKSLRIMESESISAGNSPATFSTPWCNVGLGICYDIRFPEMSQFYAKDCDLIVFPGSFSLVTGPSHWDLVARARAVDNLVYVAVNSPARDDSASYVVYGHSAIIDPWGKVLSEAGIDEEIVYSDIDPNRPKAVRDGLPVHLHRRKDIF